jgi:DNA-directed RNA polymerase specialized sigma24 family protein
MPRQSDRPTTDPVNAPDQVAPTDPRHLIDDYVMERVDYHVARLGRALHLSHHRKEDLRQDLFVALCEAAPRYDKSRAKPRTFVSRVLSLAAAHLARCICNERRNSARSPIRLSELQRDGHCFSPVAPRWCEPSAHDLVLDLRHGIAAMSRRHQQLAEALKIQTAAEVAAERRVHRSTVYREIASMRAALSGFGLGQ